VSVAVLATAVGLAPLSAAHEADPSPPHCPRLVTASADHGPLNPALEAGIAEALQDEYHGEALYGRVLKELGDVRPFANVVHAEGRHAALLEGLLESRDRAVPANAWTDAELPTFASRAEACAAAVEFEVSNVALYDRLLADDALPEDVRQVFEHNRMASQEHHKPAFERCAAGGGGPGRGEASARKGEGCGQGQCRRARARGGAGGGTGRGCGGCGGHGHGRGAGGCRRGGDGASR
jgi:hypothetical protein